MKAPHNSGPVALESRQDLVTDPCARKCPVGVGGVLQRSDTPQAQEVEHLASPDAQDRANERTTTSGHAAETGQPATSHQVQDRALDDIVRRVRQGDQSRAGPPAGAIEEVISKGAGPCLNRSAGHRRDSAFDHNLHPQGCAQRRDVVCSELRIRSQRVVEVGRHNVVTQFACGHQQSRGIRSARHRDQHSISGGQEAGSLHAEEKRV